MSAAIPIDIKIYSTHRSTQWALDRNLKCVTEADPKSIS